MKIVQLGDGKTALLRDVEQVSERARRPIIESVSSTTDGEPSMTEMNVMLDHAIVALVENWDLGFPLTADSLLDLPIKQYDELRKAVLPYIGELMPDFGPTKELEGTPTVPSVD